MTDTSTEAVKRLTDKARFECVNLEIDRKLAGEINFTIRALAAERDAMQAHVDKLEAALRPFVDYVHDDLRKGDKKLTLTPWHHGGGGWICTLDLCRARNALIEKVSK